MLNVERLLERLSAKAEILPGLSAGELEKIESDYSFIFPPDLRALLAAGLPTGSRFPDWRSRDRAELATRLAWPVNGLLFDVENNELWLDEWGQKPSEMREAIDTARRFLSGAPALIPIYSHRFICTEPNEPGNPVLSVVQADIIYYGNDLDDYFECEFFGRPLSRAFPERRVPFWHQFTDGSVEGGRSP